MSLLIQNYLIQADEGVKELIHAGDTRWLSHHDSLKRLLTLMPSIFESLKQLSSDPSQRDGTMAFGLLHRIKNFQFIFLLHSFLTVLGPFKNISLLLQSPTVDLSMAARFIHSLKDSLVAKETAFNDVWEAAATTCRDLGMNDIPFRVPRERRQYRQENFDNSSTEASGFRETLLNANDFLQKLYLPIVRSLREELNARFSHESLQIMKCISCCFPDSAEFLNSNLLAAVCEKFHLDAAEMNNSEIDAARRFLSTEHRRKPISSLSDLLCLLNVRLFPNLHTIVKILATLPVTTANNERSFSTMRRIKTHLRATMSDIRLNRLSLIATEKVIALEIPLPLLVQSFFAMKARERR
jgi:hypothetical protein